MRWCFMCCRSPSVIHDDVRSKHVSNLLRVWNGLSEQARCERWERVSKRMVIQTFRTKLGKMCEECCSLVGKKFSVIARPMYRYFEALEDRCTCSDVQGYCSSSGFVFDQNIPLLLGDEGMFQVPCEVAGAANLYLKLVLAREKVLKDRYKTIVEGNICTDCEVRRSVELVVLSCLENTMEHDDQRSPEVSPGNPSDPPDEAVGREDGVEEDDVNAIAEQISQLGEGGKGKGKKGKKCKSTGVRKADFSERKSSVPVPRPDPAAPSPPPAAPPTAGPAVTGGEGAKVHDQRESGGDHGDAARLKAAEASPPAAATAGGGGGTRIGLDDYGEWSNEGDGGDWIKVQKHKKCRKTKPRGKPKQQQAAVAPRRHSHREQPQCVTVLQQFQNSLDCSHEARKAAGVATAAKSPQPSPPTPASLLLIGMAGAVGDKPVNSDVMDATRVFCDAVENAKDADDLQAISSFVSTIQQMIVKKRHDMHSSADCCHCVQQVMGWDHPFH